MKGEQFISSTPSHRVNTSGYLRGSRINLRVAPEEICKLTLLIRRIAPVLKSPEGTTTWPPPAALQEAIAFRIASVQSKAPSPTAPKSVTSTLRLGKAGGLI